jgi:hypothetical protein
MPPRDLVARFVRERLLGEGRFTGDLDYLNMIRVREETVHELLDEVLGCDSCVWVAGASLDGRFLKYAPRVSRWIEVDTQAQLDRKASLVNDGGFDRSWAKVEQRSAETLPVEDIRPGEVVVLDGVGERGGWPQVAQWLAALVRVPGVRVVLDAPTGAEARATGLCRVGLKQLGWSLDAEYHFAEREPLIVAGGVEIASGMPALRVLCLRAP